MYADTNIFHGNIFEDAKLSMNNDAIKYNELNPKCEIIFGHIWLKHFLIIYNQVKYIVGIEYFECFKNKIYTFHYSCFKNIHYVIKIHTHNTH